MATTHEISNCDVEAPLFSFSASFTDKVKQGLKALKEVREVRPIPFKRSLNVCVVDGTPLTLMNPRRDAPLTECVEQRIKKEIRRRVQKAWRPVIPKETLGFGGCQLCPQINWLWADPEFSSVRVCWDCRRKSLDYLLYIRRLRSRDFDWWMANRFEEVYNGTLDSNERACFLKAKAAYQRKMRRFIGLRPELPQESNRWYNKYDCLLEDNYIDEDLYNSTVDEGFCDDSHPRLDSRIKARLTARFLDYDFERSREFRALAAECEMFPRQEEYVAYLHRSPDSLAPLKRLLEVYGLLRKPGCNQVKCSMHSCMKCFYAANTPLRRLSFTWRVYEIARDKLFHLWDPWRLHASNLRTPKIPKNPYEVICMDPQGPFNIKQYFTQQATDVVEDAVMDVTEKIVGKVYETLEDVKDQLPIDFCIDDHKKSLINNAITNLVHSLLSPKPSTIAWSICSILIQLGIITTSTLAALSTAITKLWQRLFSTQLPSENNTEMRPLITMQPQSDVVNSDIQELASGVIGLLFAGVCSVLSITTNTPSDLASLSKFLVKDLGSISRSAICIMTFVKNVFHIVVKIIHYCVGLKDVNYRHKKLLESHLPFVKKWLDEVLILTDPSYQDLHMSKPLFQDRVFNASVIGNSIMSALGEHFKSDNANTHIVVKMYEKLTSLKEKLVAQGKHPAVRKEVYPIWIYGKPGIGKSSLVNFLSSSLLRSVNYQTSKELVCTVNPLDKYWTLCNGQPVLLVDDMFSVESPEALNNQLCLMFMVVTNAVLCPPMADLSDKKMRYNPELFVVCSNKAFMNLACVDADAVHRRRRMLVEARLSGKVKPGCQHCIKKLKPDDTDPAELEDFHHLEFRIHSNPKDRNAEWGSWITYAEMYKVMEEDYKLWYQREAVRYNKRLTVTYSLDTGRDSHLFDVDGHQITRDALQLAYEAYRRQEVALFANKTGVLKRYLTEMKDKLEDRYEECMDWIRQKTNIMSDMFGLSPQMEFDKLLNPFEQQDGEVPSMSSKDDDVGVFSLEDQMIGRICKLRQDMSAHDCLEFLDFICPLANAVYASNEIPDSHIEYISFVKHVVINIQKMIKDEHTIVSIFDYKKFIKVAHESDKKWSVIVDFLFDVLTHTQACTFIAFIITYLRDATTHFTNLEKLKNVVNDQLIEWLYVLGSNTVHRIRLRMTKFTRYWYEIYSMFSKVSKCKHVCYDLASIDYEPSSNAYKYADTYLACKYKCVLDHAGLNRLFLLNWIMNHSWVRMQYLMGSNSKAIPVALRNYRDSIAPSQCVDNIAIIKKEITSWYANACKFIKSAYSFAKGIIVPVLEFIIKYSGTIFRFLAIFITIIGGIYSFNSVSNITNNLPNSSASGLSNTPMVLANAQSLTAYSSPAHVRLHTPLQTRVFAEGSVQQLEVVRQRIEDNSVMLEYVQGTQSIGMRCLLLKSRTLLVLRHYIEEMKQLPKNTIFRVRYIKDHEKRVGNKMPIPFDLWNMKFSWVSSPDPNVIYSSNLGVCELPPQFPEAKNLIKFIAPKKAHTHAGSVGTLCYTGRATYEMVTYKLKSAMFQVNQGLYSSTIPMEQVYTYRYQGFGMCGSVLLSNCLQTPIIGIHVAGVDGENGFGAAEPIYREMLEPSEEAAPYIDVILPELLPIDLAKINLETAVYPLGCEAPERAFNQGTTSGDVPSLIHGVFEVRTEPNPLGPRDPRLPSGCSPLKLGVEKHGLPPLEFPIEWVERAYEDLSRKICAVVLPVRQNCKKISLQEAICGNNGIEGFQPLDWSTSEGFPLNNLRPTGHTGKRWLFSLQETTNGLQLLGMEKELLRLLSLWETLYSRKIRPYTVFIDCLKDTCLPKEKCRIPGKTRIFSISPVQFTILFKQYFLDFMASYQKARFDAEHGIGMDVNSMEWTQLAMRICSKGSKIIAGDYSNFGPALSSQVASKAADIILDWYLYNDASAQDQQIRKIMMEEIIHAFHLCNNVIYQTPCGIPSGSPITAPLNSLVNCLYIRIAWLGIMKDTELDNFVAFDENVVLVTYGDDIIMNVSDKVIDYFNTITISDFFANYNIKFTDADKSNQLIKYRTLEDATFLKCHFVRHPFRPCFLASLDEISVEGTVNWIKRKGNAVENTLACVDAGINLAYGRGPEYFNWYRTRLIRALAQQRLAPALLTWNEIDNRIFSTSRVICMAPQMEQIGAQGDETGAKVDQASNVVLTEVRTESADETAPVIRSNFKLCSSDPVVRVGTLTDRWLLFKTFEWNKDSDSTKPLFSYLLPYEFVKNTDQGDICDVPNLMPFRVHRYFKGDLEVKIQVNSNKFQVGSLMVAWWYEPDADGMFDARKSVYAASQTSHVVVNASASNEACLKIPFRYHLPVLHTKPRDDLPLPLSMGRLVCFVLNPLIIATGGPQYCTGAIFIKFSNCEFSGMLSGSIDKIETTKDNNVIQLTPQMDYFTMQGAMSLINAVSEVTNRDNPPQVLPPMYVVPTGTHSWAVGTGTSEPLHPLRLDNRGQVRHPTFCPSTDEMTIQACARKYGLVKRLTWTKADDVGKNLFTVDAAPMWDTDDYEKITLSAFKNWLSLYAMPPVAIISSLFAYWRGSLEFKFDIVASSFHTGKLIVGYVPGVDKETYPSVKNSVLRCSPHVVFTLQENQSFTFKIPFISNKPWWHRYYNGNNPEAEVKPPSTLYVNVLNRLIPMQSVPESIYINVYVRAGGDFEVAIPAQPSIGLWWNAEAVYPPNYKVKAAAGYFPYYGGTWHSFVGGGYMVMRYGTASDQIAHFIGVLANTKTEGYYYTMDDTASAMQFVPIKNSGGDVDTIACTTAVFFYADWHGYYIGIPVKDSTSASSLVIDLFYNKKSPADCTKYLIDASVYKPSEYTPTDKNLSWSPVKVSFPKKLKFYSSVPDDDFVELEAQGEREENLQILSPTDDLIGTGYGSNHFGENFSSLKDYGRRYQLYTSLVLGDYHSYPVGSIACIIPILPQGLRLDPGTSDSIHEVANRCRDGHIPIIASGFRYYRGSIRIRLVFPHGTDTAVWVQHRPDRRLAAFAPITFSGVTSGRMLLNHGYASYYQITDINPVVEMEIPFYQPGAYGFLQVPKITQTEEGFYYSLGELAIGFGTPQNLSKKVLQIFYSLGDDMSFSTFQGYGPVCVLDEIVKQN